MPKKIESSLVFVLKLLVAIILVPFRFLGMIFGRNTARQVKEPLYLLREFITSARTTFWIVVVTTIISLVALFLPEDIFLLFAMYPTDILTARFFTVITAGLLHGSLGHLFGNMLGIFVFGRVVEGELGSKKTLIAYIVALILSGVSASLVNLYTGNLVPSIGASGALMGLIATAILLRPFFMTIEFGLPLPILLIGWLAVYADITGILSGVDDGIGHFAHLGGFLWMTILTRYLYSGPKERLRKGVMINMLTVLLGVVYLLMTAV